MVVKNSILNDFVYYIIIDYNMILCVACTRLTGVGGRIGWW